MAFPKRIGCLLNLLFRPSGALRAMLDGYRCLTAPARVMPALRALVDGRGSYVYRPRAAGPHPAQNSCC